MANMDSFKQRRIAPWICIILPAILFFLAWEPMPFTAFVFVAFTPLFLLANQGLDGKGIHYFGKLFLALLLWNIATTCWVWHASDVGAITMLLLNSFLMYLPFGFWRFWYRKAPRIWQLRWRFDVVFIGIWLLYEFAHHRWDLSWPWLCLGNAFSGMPWYVQWYEITGTLGGSALILGVNLLIYRAILLWRGHTQVTLKYFWQSGSKIPLVLAFSLVTAMGLVSVFMGNRVARELAGGKSYWVAAIQPNYDTYEEKFVFDPMQMLREMQATSDSAKLSLQTKGAILNCVLWPETSLVSNINVDYMESDQQVSFLKGLRNRDAGGMKYLMGVNMIQWYPWQGTGRPEAVMPDGSVRLVTAARQSNDPNYWYTLHNSVLWLGDTLNYYHKSKLVPGTEQLPFVSTIPFLESLAISLDENSASGTLGKSDRAMALGDEVKVAPVICYESIYGDYVSDYVGNGAQWLAVVTNDAWWKNTAGHKQHFSYAKLRAIEQRKWVGRSANTGISGFINPLGESVMESVWYQGRAGRCDVPLADIECKDSGFVVSAGTQLAMVQRIVPNDIKTIYQQLGDVGVLVMLMVLLLSMALRSRGKMEYLSQGAVYVAIETVIASI